MPIFSPAQITEKPNFRDSVMQCAPNSEFLRQKQPRLKLAKKEGSAQESVATMIFGRFLHFVIYDSAAAVAVGMWEAAFCAASQAWRAGRKMPSQNSLSRPPSVISTANSRISGIFGGFSPFRPAFGAKCVILKTRLI